MDTKYEDFDMAVDITYLVGSIGDEKISNITSNDMYKLEHLIGKMMSYPYKTAVLKDYISNNYNNNAGTVRDALMETVVKYPCIEDVNILNKTDEKWLLYKTVKRVNDSNRAVIYVDKDSDTDMTEMQRDFLSNMNVHEVLYMKEYDDEYIAMTDKFQNINYIVVKKDEDQKGKMRELTAAMLIMGAFAYMMAA